MRGWSRAQLLFANHRRILQIKHVWGSLTTCHLLSPRLDNEDGRTPGKTRDYFFFSLLYQKKKPRNKKTRYDILSECCCRPTDAPTALFVYDLPTQSLCMYLPWLCSTCDNCLPMHLSVCLCVCETLTPGTPYEKVQVCAVQGTKSVLFAAHISPCVSIGEGNKGPDGVFGAAQVSPFCQSAPLPLLKLLQLSRAQHLSRKKKKTKASSSWTILPGSMTPLLSHSVKSEQLETRGVSVIREAPYEVICRESTFETSPMNECDADCVRGTS